MTFDVNQTVFPSPQHQHIWNIGRQILPLDISLADIDDEQTREGCTQIYNWTQKYLETMYQKPEQYAGGDPYALFRMLDSIAEDAVIAGGGLVFSCKLYDRLMKSFGAYMADLPLLGFDVDDQLSGKILRNRDYPLLCLYFKRLYEAANRKKVNRLDYLVFNDFRVLAPKYKRSLDDLLRTLPDDMKKFAVELHEYALKKGAKLESHQYYCFFRYKYKKETVLVLQKNGWRHTPLDMAVSYLLHGHDVPGSLDCFLQAAESQSDADELIRYIQKEICKCDACRGAKTASTRCQQWKDVHGVRRLLAGCHSDISKWKAPRSNLVYTEDDLRMLKRMIDIRFLEIERAGN